MHPSLRRYIALSQAVLQALKTTGSFVRPEDVPTPVVDLARSPTTLSGDRPAGLAIVRLRPAPYDRVVAAA
jgi:hypothetical protein